MKIELEMVKCTVAFLIALWSHFILDISLTTYHHSLQISPTKTSKNKQKQRSNQHEAFNEKAFNITINP